MKDKYSVYLIGPISGLNYYTTISWREKVRQLLPSHIVGYSPMRAKAYLEKEKVISDSYEETLFSSQRGIFARDMHDCLNCDAGLAYFTGAKTVSIGSVMEIQSFWMRRRPIVLVMEEEGNPHDHPMIREACPFVVRTVEQAVYALDIILTPVEH